MPLPPLFADLGNFELLLSVARLARERREPRRDRGQPLRQRLRAPARPKARRGQAGRRPGPLIHSETFRELIDKPQRRLGVTQADPGSLCRASVAEVTARRADAGMAPSG